MKGVRTLAIWLALGAVTIPALYLSATSPLLQWRDPIYILGGFSGVVALSILLLQPLLALRLLPGLSPLRARRLHRVLGAGLVLAVIIHVGGLWVTSPPDVIDALLLVSPTPFAIWGVLAMWVIFAAATLAACRKYWRWGWRKWRRLHSALASRMLSTASR